MFPTAAAVAEIASRCFAEAIAAPAASRDVARAAGGCILPTPFSPEPAMLSFRFVAEERHEVEEENELNEDDDSDDEEAKTEERLDEKEEQEEGIEGIEDTEDIGIARLCAVTGRVDVLVLWSWRSWLPGSAMFAQRLYLLGAQSKHLLLPRAHEHALHTPELLQEQHLGAMVDGPWMEIHELVLNRIENSS